MLKPVPKKDQPKVIALSVLAAGLAGTAFVQLNAGDDRLAEAQKVAAARAAEKSASASPTAATASRVTRITPVAPIGAAGVTPSSGGFRPATPGLVAPVSAAGGAAVPGVDESAARVVGDNGAVFDLGVVGPPVGGKDPFQTQVPTVASTVVPAPAPTPAPAKLPDTSPRNSSGAAGRLGRLLDNAGITSTVPNKVSRGGGVSIAEVMNGGGGVSGPGAAPVPTYAPTAATTVVTLPPPPPPAVMVSGIVLGVSEPGNPSNSSVAMLRSGDAVSGGAAASVGGGERRFVRVGDNVGNGFVVAQIHSDSVIIKSGKRRFTLYLGVKPEWLASAAPGAGAASYAPSYNPAGNSVAYTGKDAAQSADKNTSNNYYAPAALNSSVPAPNRFGANPAVSAAASPAGSQIGESFRAK